MADAEQEILFLLGGLLLYVVHYITSVRGTGACSRMDGCQMSAYISNTPTSLQTSIIIGLASII